MLVYVIRHGESENNLKGLWTGWYDAPLTDKGILDAKKVGEYLSGISFDKIYSSDLTRAVLTAHNAIEGCTVETSELLREVNVGDLANMPLSSISDEQRAKAAKDGYELFGGESKQAFVARVCEFMKKLKTLECDNVAVFSHAGWLRTILDIVVGVTLPRKSIRCNNCTVGIFEYSDGVWRLFSWINLK
jgi:broad specificity phosphatase PhoE